MVRAIGVAQPGGPDDLRVLDVAPEALGPDQIRINVTAATVNPADAMIRSRPPQDEHDSVRVPGMEVAGTVVDIGANVDRALSVGDEVIAIVVPSAAHGGYREDLVVPANSAARAPAGLSRAEAATIPMNGLTAQLALDSMDLPAGSIVAVTGSAGIVGGYFIQLAKLAGLTVVADAAPDDEAFVRSVGADVVVPRGDDFVEAVLRYRPGGVDGLLDAAVLDAGILPAVKEGGVVVTVRGYQGDGTDRIRVVPIFVRSYVEAADRLDRLAAIAAAGGLTVRVAQELPAEEASVAHHALTRAGSRGRTVLRF